MGQITLGWFAASGLRPAQVEMPAVHLLYHRVISVGGQRDVHMGHIDRRHYSMF